MTTNLKYHIHIRTTTNLEYTYDLYNALSNNLQNAQSVVSSRSTTPDSNGTYFNHILTADSTMLYSENITDNYTIVIDYPQDTQEINYHDAKYSGIAEMIEINIESSQILQSDT